MAIRWNIEKIQNWLDNNAYGYKIIDKDYNWRNKVNLICPNNHLYFVSWDSFCNGGHRCPECNGIHFYTYDEIYNIFKINDCELITNKEEFKSTNYPLKFICNKHKDKGIQTKNFSNFIDGHKCKYCGYELFSKSQRLDGNYILQTFINLNLTPLFTENEYKNNEQKLLYICNKHPDYGIQYIDFSHLQRNQQCYICRIENRSNKNHWNWKGGLTTINDFLRSCPIADKWKIDSFCFSENKCVLTSKKTYKIVHHLYPFYKIRNNILKNFPNIKNIKDCSDQVLIDIMEEYKLQNNKYGITIHKKIHKLFHDYYNYYNNTPSQFLEFVQRLENSEFNNYLLDNNLSLNINYEILNKLLGQFDLEYKIIK